MTDRITDNELEEYGHDLLVCLKAARDYANQFEAWDAEHHRPCTANGGREMTNKIVVPVELLKALAPATPVNQDEVGGCVWCGGTPKNQSYGYATANPKDHDDDCPWVLVQILLKKHGIEHDE